jgi:peptidyl-prolyl cis-trans isomerase D
MIQSFQKFSQSRVAKVFLAIVALSFLAFFGGGGWFRPHDPHAVVANVGTLSISRYELAEKVQQASQRLATQSGQAMTPEQLLEAGLPQMILWGLINDLLLNLEAKHLGLTVSDDVIRDRIHSMKAFQNAKGEFDREHFEQILRSNGFSEESFIAEIREELIREQLANAVMVGAYLPEEMVDSLFTAQYQYRQASMVVVSASEIPPPAAPSEDVLQAFYKENKQGFKRPELRNITLLMLDPDVIAKGIVVSPEEIKSIYEAKPDLYGKMTLENATPLIMAEVQKEKATEQIFKITQDLDDKIAGGATFEELAPTVQGAQLLKLKEMDKNGRDQMGVLIFQTPNDKEVAEEVLKTAFELDEGSDIPFTQARNGAAYTLKVDKIMPSALQPFSEIKDLVLKKWTETEQYKAAYAKAEKYVNDFNQGSRNVALMSLLPNLSLSEPSPTVPSDVKNLVYSLHLNQAGVTRVPEGFAVVVLNKIIPPDPKVREEKIASFKESLLKHYQNDLLTSYVNALHVRYPVKINNSAIKALYTK